MPKKPKSEYHQTLERRQDTFIREFLVDGNATRAAITAGYSEKSAPAQASRLLKNANVSSQIAARQAKVASKIDITIEKIAQEYAAIAFRDARQLFDQEGKLIPIHKLSREAAAAIDGIKVKRKRIGRQRSEDDEDGDSEGGVEEEVEILEYKLSNKTTALADLGKHLGFFGKEAPPPSLPPTYVQTQMILNVLSLEQLEDLKRKMQQQPDMKADIAAPTIEHKPV